MQNSTSLDFLHISNFKLNIRIVAFAATRLSTYTVDYFGMARVCDQKYPLAMLP